jgi:P4 family phage/plasmid primase-like protien
VNNCPPEFAALFAALDPEGTIRAKFKGEVSASPSPSTQPTGNGVNLRDRLNRASKYLAKLPLSIQGQDGSGAAYRVAREICYGFDLDTETALRLILDEYNPQCVPPWSEKEWRHKLEDAQTKPFGQSRGWLLNAKRPEAEAKPTKPAKPPRYVAPQTPPPVELATPIEPTTEHANSPLTMPVGRQGVNELDDDPGRLARCVLAGYRHGNLRTLIYRFGHFYEWGGVAYRMVIMPDFRARVHAAIRRELERCNLFQLKAWKDAGSNGDAPAMLKVTIPLVNNVIGSLESLCRSTIETAPAWIKETTTPATEYLSARNGIVHLPSYAAGAEVITPHDPHYFSMNAVEFSVDRLATSCPHWGAFLASAFPGDTSSVALLQEWMGYLLTQDNSMQKMLFLNGAGRSGKGTIIEVISALVGAANVANPTLETLSGPFGLASLLGKQVALIGDARLSKVTVGGVLTERLLTISGGNKIDINQKHRAVLTERLNTRFVISSNDMVDLQDSSGALARRWSVLVFRQSFYGREDLGLKDRLLSELPAIFNWAIAGWVRLREQGKFTVPQASRELMEEMMESSSPISAFVSARCECGPQYTVLACDLYDSWKRWCDAEGRDRPGDSSRFGKMLRSYMPTLSKRRVQRNGVQMNEYIGLRIAEPGYTGDLLPYEQNPNEAPPLATEAPPLATEAPPLTSGTPPLGLHRLHSKLHSETDVPCNLENTTNSSDLELL